MAFALFNELPLLAEVDKAQPALLDDANAEWLSYGDLIALAEQWSQSLSGERGLVFLYAHNNVETVAAFLGACRAGHAVALFDPALTEALRLELSNRYQPEWTIDTQQASCPNRRSEAVELLHADLSVLLSTSGSTGSPKLVRLTMQNINANARGIADVLQISENDVACGHLPLHYSYGLSVLTSHLIQGARIRLTAMSFTDRAFWPAMREAEITHLPGVPFHFQMLQKLGFRRINIPSIKSVTQAGGFLNLGARKHAHEFMEQTGGRFYVMYGQTEASPRMTTLTHENFTTKPESVGTALPECEIKIIDADENGRGEVAFHGPNVMMGYAECRADLALGDELHGRLLTGDIGYLSDESTLTLTGRTKRFGKIFGLRVNLDEIESFSNVICEAAVTHQEDKIILHLPTSNDHEKQESNRDKLLTELVARYALPKSCYTFKSTESIPRTERGKIDYAALSTD